MNTNINLLLRTDEESLRQKKRLKILNYIAITSLIGIGLISLVIFLLIQITGPESINKEQISVLGKISQFQNKPAKVFVLNNRLENIDKVMKIKNDLSKTMGSILAKVPNNLFINGFEVDGVSVILSAESKSLFAIGEFINNLTDMVRKKEIIKSLILNSLIFDDAKNTYQVLVKSEL